MYKINELNIKNFKFFHNTDILKFESKNILIYGENGSGKSSIYWALYTFFQSSLKNSDEVKKYFDLEKEDSLVNIYEVDDTKSKIEINLKYKDNIEPEKTFLISKNSVNTNSQDTTIKKACYIGDFISYKYLFRFFDFFHKEKINLFRLFEYEILHSIIREGDSLNKLWIEILNLVEKKPRTHQDKTDFDELQNKISKFNIFLNSLIERIIAPSNEYIKKFGYENIEIGLSVSNCTYSRLTFVKPEINFSVKLIKNEQESLSIEKSQSFFNEAKLTAIALSVRFGITKIKYADLSDSLLKVLVLDDLLVSLDMSNREKVLNLLLEDEVLSNYQIIILTHDKAFFEKAKRKFDFLRKKDWKYVEMYLDFDVNKNIEKPYIKASTYYFEKARELFSKKEYSESANNLRKDAEELLKKFLPEVESRTKGGGSLMLQGLIDKARSYANNERSYQKFDSLIKKIDKVTDYEKFYKEMKNINDTMSFNEINKSRILDILYELEELKNTLLNPQSHHDIQTQIYREEIEDAMELIEKFRKIVNKEV